MGFTLFVCVHVSFYCFKPSSYHEFQQGYWAVCVRPFFLYKKSDKTRSLQCTSFTRSQFGLTGGTFTFPVFFVFFYTISNYNLRVLSIFRACCTQQTKLTCRNLNYVTQTTWLKMACTDVIREDIPIGHVTIRWSFSNPCFFFFPWLLENSSWNESKNCTLCRTRTGPKGMVMWSDLFKSYLKDPQGPFWTRLEVH